MSAESPSHDEKENTTCKRNSLKIGQTIMLTPQEEMRSAVEHIAAFAATARPEHLISDIRQLFKRNIFG
jgi:hypothetical protein